MKTVFGDPGLVMKTRQAPIPHYDKIQIGTNKDDAKDAKV